MHYPLAMSSWSEEEIEAIQRVIRSDMFSMGSYVEQFEKEFSDFFGAKFSVMVNSGSSANLLAIASLFFKKENPLKRGDEVIVPAVSWSTTYTPLQQYGLKVKFVDIDLETLNFDLKSLENAITDKTKLIFAVNLLGNPNDFEAILKLMTDREIYLLEDNCESMGARFKDRYTGTFGLMGTYSTFFSHHISTMEGGVVTTDDEELYHIMLSMRAHGWTRNLPRENLVTGIKSDNPFDESFKFVLPGYNLRPLEMSGSIGVEQLKKLQSFVSRRRENAELFRTLFSEFDDFILQKELGESSWFGFSMVIKEDSQLQREKLISYLSENGVESRPIVTGNFTKNEVIKYFDYEIVGELRNSDLIDSNGLFLGNHHVDMTAQITSLYKSLKNYLK